MLPQKDTEACAGPHGKSVYSCEPEAAQLYLRKEEEEPGRWLKRKLDDSS